jgi:hypothetical protein
MIKTVSCYPRERRPTVATPATPVTNMLEATLARALENMRELQDRTVAIEAHVRALEVEAGIRPAREPVAFVLVKGGDAA